LGRDFSTSFDGKFFNEYNGIKGSLTFLKSPFFQNKSPMRSPPNSGSPQFKINCFYPGPGGVEDRGNVEKV
jgi:hypothetical protein